jgi:hypothetical protein
MEDAVMTYRIVRSPERRVFKIGVGNIAPQDVPAFMERAKSQLRRNQIVDGQGRIDLRLNPQNILEDFFIPVRGERDGTDISNLAGGQYVGDIEDLNYIRDKLLASLRIPKAYLGYQDGEGNKATLSQLDSRFARTIQKIQRVLISELNKVAIIHLYSAGIRGEELFNFEISMANPSMIAELQSLELWRTKLEVASLAQQGAEGATFDTYFIYKNIFKLSDEEIEGIEEGKKKDKLFQLSLNSIDQAGTMATGEEEMPADMTGGVGSASPVDIGPDGTPQVPQEVPQGAPPEAGLPPPPGEEQGGSGPALDTAARDPTAQRAVPNDMLNPGHSNNHDPNKLPDLKTYTYNTKKTGMDHKRNYSELMRAIKAPFGEELEQDLEGEELEEAVFRRNLTQLRKFAEDLENIEAFNKAAKKVLKD